MAASRRSQAALLCQSQQKRGQRGGVSNRTQGASSSPVGARETRQCHKRGQGRDLPSARSVGGFGGSRRFFRIERGTFSGFAPANREKIAAHTIGKVRRPIRGDIQGGSPLGSLLHPFLERKGWRAVPAAKPRCGVIRDKVVGNANSVSDKTVGATC